MLNCLIQRSVITTSMPRSASVRLGLGRHGGYRPLDIINLTDKPAALSQKRRRCGFSVIVRYDGRMDTALQRFIMDFPRCESI
ncbi:hypothetical protein OK016_28055 [Vibrio chagasii]|nr:hypothetical protein [Vibrio chagasii]